MLAGPVAEERHHSVGFYRDDVVFEAAVGAFVAAGLTRGETVVMVATAGHQAQIDEHLVAAGHDVAALRSNAQYVTFDAEQELGRFMVDGRPDPTRFEQVLGTMVLSFAGRERPLRIYGEMVGVLWADGNVTGAIELEELWNGLRRRGVFELHCGYDVDGSGPEADLEALRRVCGAHTELTTPCWSGTEVHADHERTSVFLPAPQSIGGVRRFVGETLTDWGLTGFLSDAVLAASELSTNAVAHAESPFAVSIHRSPGSFRIQVRDTNPGQPQLRAPLPMVSGGRGLGIVATLAGAWGIEPHLPGKSVWARFDTV